MEALIDLLLDWVARNTPYETAAMPHPAVVELSPELLTREFYSGIASLMPEDGVDERLNALFAVTDGPHGTIYILDADSIDGASHYEDTHENPLWREILLHELVHHAQAQSGAVAGWECRRHGKMEACCLGGCYLDEARIEDPMPNRIFWAHAHSGCRVVVSGRLADAGWGRCPPWHVPRQFPPEFVGHDEDHWGSSGADFGLERAETCMECAS